jgi:hypothetical protein
MSPLSKATWHRLTGAWGNLVWAAMFAIVVTQWGRVESLWGRPFAAVVFACTFGVMFAVATAAHYWSNRGKTARATSVTAVAAPPDGAKCFADYERASIELTKSLELEREMSAPRVEDNDEMTAARERTDRALRQMHEHSAGVARAFGQASANEALALVAFAAIDAVLSATSERKSQGSPAGGTLSQPRIADVQMVIKRYRADRLP